MSIDRLMRTSVSGMNAQSSRLNSVAGNVANAQTVGYKRVDTQFSTLLAETTGGLHRTAGVEARSRQMVSSQGLLQSTASRYDLAIRGNGFMIVERSGSGPVLTRAGAFVPDASGQLVNAAGYTLLGSPIVDGVAQGGTTATDLVPVTVGTNSLAAKPTSLASLSANLAANAAPVDAADQPSVNAANSTSTSRTSLIVYDNLGAAVTLDVHFTKTTVVGEWEATVFDAADRPSAGNFPYAAGPLASLTLQFDAFGVIDPPGSAIAQVAIPNGQVATIDLSSMRQLAAEFAVLDARANGNPVSSIASVDIDDQGIVYEVYDTGLRRAVFRIPLAMVNSPDNLSMLDGNAFAATSKSGDVRVGWPGTAGYGAIVAGALEASTVDIATELTDMISAQRNYTANSRVFQAGAEIMEVIVNLKR